MRTPVLFRCLLPLTVLSLPPACGEKADPAGGTSDTEESSDTETTASASESNSSTTGDTTDDSASATDTAATGSTSSATTTDSGGFIDPPDGGVVGQCDPGLQDCPNPDEKCTAFATEPGTCCVDSNKCVPVIGNGLAGEECTRTEDNDDCAKGFFCTTKTSGSTGVGFCEQLCVDDPSCDEGACIIYNDGVLPLCRIECDPLLQDCAAPGFGCYPASDTFVCGKPANDEGSGNDGDACSTLRSCLPGLACVVGSAVEGCAQDGRCCTAFCDISEPDPCTAASEMCVAWFEAGTAPPEYMNVGACLIPQ